MGCERDREGGGVVAGGSSGPGFRLLCSCAGPPNLPRPPRDIISCDERLDVRELI